MNTVKVVEHDGIVREISDGKMKIGFIAKSACAHCQLKGICSESDIEDKEVEVQTGLQTYQIGEKVNIVLARSLGLKALAYGYLIPFVLVLVSLFVVYDVIGNEVISGLSSIAILVPYYTGLYLFRNRIRKEFKFRVHKFI